MIKQHQTPLSRTDIVSQRLSGFHLSEFYSPVLLPSMAELYTQNRPLCQATIILRYYDIRPWSILCCSFILSLQCAIPASAFQRFL